MNNAELGRRATEIAAALEGIEEELATLVDVKTDERERQQRARERAIARDLVQHGRAFVQNQPAAPTPRAVPNWPWTAATTTQGFLAGRWLRRDGNVYAGAALRGIPGPNSPIAGGQDNQAKVDVPSGAPRV